MYTISTNPFVEWFSTLPEDSPWNLPVATFAAFMTMYYLIGSILAVIAFSDWYAGKFTSIAGDPADSLLTRALHLGLWLDGSVLVVVGVLVSPLGIFVAMVAAPLVALWVVGREAIGRHVSARRQNGKGVVEMLFLDAESPVQMAAVAIVVGGLILSQWWTA
ncbi:hypothetical protein ACHAQH_000134 [Verticillium albo-atrum]